MAERAVQVSDLEKRYPKSATNAVDGLSFTVGRGEVFGLLGPNGAGKTTTVGVLTTRVLPTGGQARVAGLDVVADAVAVRSRLAVVPQRVNLDRSLSVRDNLVFHAAYHGVGRVERGRRADELLERLGLTDKARAVVDDLSGGQSQRVMIARGLMHRPEVLFLDEPSTGLDPQARLFVHQQIRELRDDGVTIVLTTHDMDEAHKLADRVGIVDHGRLLALDTPDALVRSVLGGQTGRCGTVEVSVTPDGVGPSALVEVLGAMAGVQRIEQLGAAVSSTTESTTASGTASANGAGPAAPGVGTNPAAAGSVRLRLYVDGEPAAMLVPVVGVLAAHGAALTAVTLGEPTLEDVFISLTGRELR